MHLNVTMGYLKRQIREPVYGYGCIDQDAMYETWVDIPLQSVARSFSRDFCIAREDRGQGTVGEGDMGMGLMINGWFSGCAEKAVWWIRNA